MYDKLLCVVLRTADYRDYDKMLTLFSPTYGKLSALARGCRKQGSALMSVSDTFCCAEFGLYKKKNHFTVTQAALRENFFGLRADLNALSAASAMTEACSSVAMENQPNPRLFSLLVNALYALEHGMPPANALCFFTFKLMDILGLRPELSACVLCGKPRADKLNLSAGGAVCEACPGETVPAVFFQNIVTILQTPSRRMAEVHYDQAAAFFSLAFRWLCSLLEFQPKSLAYFNRI